MTNSSPPTDTRPEITSSDVIRWRSMDVTDVLAEVGGTILSLQRERDESNAKVAALVEMVRKSAVLNIIREDGAEIRSCRHCGNYDFDTADDASVFEHHDGCFIVSYDPSSAAKELLERVADLEASVVVLNNRLDVAGKDTLKALSEAAGLKARAERAEAALAEAREAYEEVSTRASIAAAMLSEQFPAMANGMFEAISRGDAVIKSSPPTEEG